MSSETSTTSPCALRRRSSAHRLRVATRLLSPQQVSRRGSGRDMRDAMWPRAAFDCCWPCCRTARRSATNSPWGAGARPSWPHSFAEEARPCARRRASSRAAWCLARSCSAGAWSSPGHGSASSSGWCTLVLRCPANHRDGLARFLPGISYRCSSSGVYLWKGRALRSVAVVAIRCCRRRRSIRSPRPSVGKAGLGPPTIAPHSEP
mmetsp:Transcript_110940/g.320637  ORF Transcript_110940/g.320637 Transcript_110940/m.320637 type:complete len:206 (-) Transcript_110940:275-892(-)